MALGYEEDQPTRDQVDALTGPAVVEFGTDWCGHCRAAARFVEPVLGEHPEVRRVRVEDGKGRPLGRSFRVKLWPTLVFLRDGEEVARLVRPGNRALVEDAVARVLQD